MWYNIKNIKIILKRFSFNNYMYFILLSLQYTELVALLTRSGFPLQSIHEQICHCLYGDYGNRV
jgi:hypothetical protein